MAYGTLTVICGPMYAGKTTEILKRVLWARNGEARDVLVLKPSFDNRYSETEIVSHNGLRAVAQSVSELPEVTFRRGLIVLDEVQFFDPSNRLVEWVQDRLEEGHDVVAAGLDMAWNGAPFEATASLAAMADEVMKLSAHCTLCGRPARKTYKKDQTGGVVELGAHDKYEARCNEHWAVHPLLQMPHDIIGAALTPLTDDLLKEAQAALDRIAASAPLSDEAWAAQAARFIVEGGTADDARVRKV